MFLRWLHLTYSVIYQKQDLVIGVSVALCYFIMCTDSWNCYKQCIELPQYHRGLCGPVAVFSPGPPPLANCSRLCSFVTENIM